MKAPLYIKGIIKDCLIPFVQEIYPDHHRLMKDNDPKHNACDTQAFTTENDINWWGKKQVS